MATKQKTKNTLDDLHGILMEQLERLNDLDPVLDKEQFEAEIHRSKALSDVGKVICSNNANQISALKLYADTVGGVRTPSRILIGDAEEDS